MIVVEPWILQRRTFCGREGKWWEAGKQIGWRAQYGNGTLCHGDCPIACVAAALEIEAMKPARIVIIDIPHPPAALHPNARDHWRTVAGAKHWSEYRVRVDEAKAQNGGE